MFRAMKKRQQELSEQDCIKILNQATSGVLAVDGDDGYPYAVPLSFMYDDGTIIFHGAKTGHKIDAVTKNPKASFCIIAQDHVIPEQTTTDYRSLIAFGKVRIVEGTDEKRKAIEGMCEKYCPGRRAHWGSIIEGMMTQLCIFKLEIEYMTGKRA